MTNPEELAEQIKAKRAQAEALNAEADALATKATTKVELDLGAEVDSCTDVQFLARLLVGAGAVVGAATNAADVMAKLRAGEASLTLHSNGVRFSPIDPDADEAPDTKDSYNLARGYL